MDAQLLISGVIFGLSIGSIFFLLAIGLSLCFGLMRIISLDQLFYYSVGAFIPYTVHATTGNTWIGVFVGMAVAGLASFAVERFVFYRIYDARYHLHNDRVLRHSDRRCRRHQIHLGNGPPAGAHTHRGAGNHSGHGDPRLPVDDQNHPCCRG